MTRTYILTIDSTGDISPSEEAEDIKNLLEDSDDESQYVVTSCVPE